MSLWEAQQAMPLEKKISMAKHATMLDRICSALAGSNARLAEVSLTFDKDIKECGTGKHSLTSIADRLTLEVADQLRSSPSLNWREIAMALTKDPRVISRLAWYFI